MPAARLTESLIRAGASDKSFARGQEFFRSKAVSRLTLRGNILSGECEGTSSPFYRVRAEVDGGGIRSADCTCPYDFGGYCKHLVALLLAYARAPQMFTVSRTPAELLADLSREQLLTVLVKLLDEQPDLSDQVELMIAAPSVSRRGTPTRGSRKIDAEAYRRRVRGIMHSLDRMRMSEAYWHVGGLVGELRGVEATAMEFLTGGDAEAALRILVTLLEESHDGFEYIDDSNGELGDFLSGVGESLAEAILSCDLSEKERTKLVGELNSLHGELSDYGVEGLDVAIAAARHGWNESPLEAQAASQQVSRDEEPDEWTNEDDDFSDELYAPAWSSESPAQELTRAKLNVLERQERTDEYLALCLRTGAHLRYALKLCALDRQREAVAHALKNLSAADEALTLAQALRESNHLDDAVKIGERGLQLAGRKAALGAWLGAIEEARGRTPQALAAWLAAFSDAPSLVGWQIIKRLAGAGWNKLKPEAITSLEKFYDKRPLAEVLLHEGEWDAAIQVANRSKQDHTLVALVADALITRRPDWVIRTSVKQAEALIVLTKSNLYPVAADWLRRAKAAHAHLGQDAEWQKYLRELKEQYKRRPALQTQLASLS
ncbi:MAG: SWIM zinc finger domain-containing protein [Pyrinomonadaceae bacterium]|nr:SWIM zinc finger domain-containing protein [Pyrinomonadaceae bacterium]